uniref:Uncharacterized protein n=1 Tax=Siphoviridae sp. ctm7X10 TaxID=2827929 RepID=A0A8S5S4Y0_9CAUD|nr:MAG TPA: hypothetical protein [Siphoviridae sp. ctm7X10]
MGRRSGLWAAAPSARPVLCSDSPGTGPDGRVPVQGRGTEEMGDRLLGGLPHERPHPETGTDREADETLPAQKDKQ